MATYVVTTRDDVVDAGDGVLSLREALARAEAHAGADTITFDQSVFTAGDSTILLTQGQLGITQAGGPVTIQGDLDGNHTADVTIDAGRQGRVLDIHGASASQQAQVSLQGLVVTGGDTYGYSTVGSGENGGGIHLGYASVDIVDCVVSDNVAPRGGGIASENSTLTISGTDVSWNSAEVTLGAGTGGGLFADGGSVTLTDCTISHNAARGYRTESAHGGGIFVTGGDLEIVGTSVSYNSARSGIYDRGGGLYVIGSELTIAASRIDHNIARGIYGGHGGGIEARSTTGSIVDTTIDLNSAKTSGGGLLISGSTDLRITNTTIVANVASASVYYATAYGGGIAGTGVLLKNTIVAGNSSDIDADISGEIVSNGHNLFSQTSITGAAASDIVVNSNEAIGTVLAPLRDNGGPTFSYIPLPAGPAVDAGDTADAVDANGDPLTTDQRGEPRVVGGAVDIGAVEAGGANLVIGTAHADVLVGSAGADRIEAWTGDDTVVGLAGADTLEAAAGNDSVQAGDGDDYVLGGAGDDTVFLGTGDDFLRDPSGANRLHGDAGDDSIVAGVGADLLFGGEGADTLAAATGADTVAGDAGEDSIDAGGGRDLVYGGEGDDSIMGGYGADSLYGGDGADTIDGGPGGDLVWLGSGADSVVAGSGDTIYAGSGNDQLDLGDAGNIHVFAGSGIDIVSGGGSDAIVRLGGGGDADFGGGFIYGEAGDDLIRLAEHGRLADGGDGDDRIYIYSASITGATLRGGAGDDLIEASAIGSTDNLVQGGAGDDTLNGGTSIFGGDGDDRISLFGGIATGGSGDDWILAGWSAAGQTMRGADGDDTLTVTGYAGRMSGGEGADLFAFGFGESRLGNKNVLADFTPGDDRIDLRAFDALETYADLQALFEDRGANTAIHLSELSGSRGSEKIADVLLLGVTLADLDHPENFLL